MPSSTLAVLFIFPVLVLAAFCYIATRERDLWWIAVASLLTVCIGFFTAWLG